MLVVVPTYNERENVIPLIRELLALRPDIDVWVADDGSPDGTAEAVREAMREHPGRVDLLLRDGKGGRGAAVIAAFRRASRIREATASSSRWTPTSPTTRESFRSSWRSSRPATW